MHEDYAGYPSVIDQALAVTDLYDVQIAMHTDGINESCELHETVAAIMSRRAHPEDDGRRAASPVRRVRWARKARTTGVVGLGRGGAGEVASPRR